MRHAVGCAAALFCAHGALACGPGGPGQLSEYTTASPSAPSASAVQGSATNQTAGGAERPAPTGHAFAPKDPVAAPPAAVPLKFLTSDAGVFRCGVRDDQTLWCW